MIFIPSITEHSQMGDFNSDLFSYLLQNRIIFLTGRINEDMANIIVAQLLFLESKSSEEDIYLYIQSSGGSVTAGFSIYDTIQYIKPDVCTICFGVAASMAAVLLSSGTRGKRLAFQNSEIMIHQVKGGSWGQATDIEIHADRIKEMNENLIEILADNCNRPFEEVFKDANRDNFMNAERALEYGLIDKVIYNKPKRPTRQQRGM